MLSIHGEKLIINTLGYFLPSFILFKYLTCIFLVFVDAINLFLLNHNVQVFFNG